MKRAVIFAPLVVWGATIQQIKFEGLRSISPTTIRMKLLIHRGDPFDLQRIDRSIRALYKIGIFKQIVAEREGDTLIFKFTEKPRILKVTYRNVPEELKKLMEDENVLIKRGQLYNQLTITKLREFIKGYYTAKGYEGTYVDVSTRPYRSNPNVLDLIITVHKGEKIVIRNVNLYGVKKVDKSDLIDLMENQPRTLTSVLPFANSGYLSLYHLPTDWEKVVDYYLNHGFMDVKVSRPYAKVNRDSYFAEIDYQIEEGPQYRVSSVKVNYPSDLNVTLPDLLLEPGKYFNISAMRQDIKNLTHAFQNLGYAFPKVVPSFEKRGDKVAVTYNVEPGNLYYIRKVIITGNRKTLDRVIRRYVYLLPGHRFSYQDLEDSRRRLKRSGYFSDVNITTRRVNDHLLDVLVRVKEGLSGSLVAGISYGSYYKFGFNFKVEERNIFGSGQTLKAAASVSSKYSDYSLSLFNPSVLDSPYSLSAGLYSTRFEGISYTTRRKGGYLGIGRELTRNLSTSLTFNYAKIKLENYPTTLTYLRDSYIKKSLVWGVKYNTTNDFYFPTEGILIDGSVEYAGLGGDEKFTKYLITGKGYYPLTNDYYETVAVFKLRGTYGFIKDNGYLPINERFFLGGLGTIRGFEWYSISPKDSDGNLIGGKKEFIISPAVATPLSKKAHMWLTGFIDYGGVGEDKIDITRSSYGVSLEWITPMAPISFVWAWPIKTEAGDKLQHFEFNIGMGW
jgi:outer membrane protein insertion porin family